MPRRAGPRHAAGRPADAFRDRLTDLAGGLRAHAAGRRGVHRAVGAVRSRRRRGRCWAACSCSRRSLTWAMMLIGAAAASGTRRTRGAGRAIQLVVGLGVGALAFWLDGWALPTGTANATVARPRAVHQPPHQPGQRSRPGCGTCSTSGWRSALCRWWIATDRKRKRAACGSCPLVAAGFWGRRVPVPVAVGIGAGDARACRRW